MTKPSRIVKSAHKGRPESLKNFARSVVNSKNINTDPELHAACEAWLKRKGLLPGGGAS